MSFSAFGERAPGEVTVDIPKISVTVNKATDGTADFSAKSHFGAGGEPMLPVQTVQVMLPPSTDLSTVKVSLCEVKTSAVEGTWDIKPVPPVSSASSSGEIWPKGAKVVNGYDQNIYRENAYFPKSHIRQISAGGKRVWNLVDVVISPYQYNPVTKKLRRLEAGSIVVTFSEKAAKGGAATKSDSLYIDNTSKKLEKQLKNECVNFDEMVREYSDLAKSSAAAGPAIPQGLGPVPSVAPGYIIVTTNAIVAASTQLNNFIISKQNLGFNVYVATESYWGGGSGDAAANNIRSWLKLYYLWLNAEYVLLIGNPNPTTGDVPMKMCWPRFNEATYRESPSDMFHAELTGNWDLDGDGNFGEFDGDVGPGGADRFCELSLGRIPYYGTMTDLDAILAKTVAYENALPSTTQWRRRCLLPMKPMDGSTPSYQLGENILNNILIPEGGWARYRVYDQNYSLTPPPEATPCTPDNVTTGWSAYPTGITIWQTHGSSQSASSVMDLAHVAMLSNTTPSFTFQASCNNSYPEDVQNLSYSILKNGGIVTVGATRVSWYYVGQTNYTNTPSIGGMAYAYAMNVIANDQTAGDALVGLKSTLNPSINEMWMNWTDFNVYGDPSLALNATQGPTDPCDNPIIINGSGFNYTYYQNYNVTPEGICIRMHNNDYMHGMMFTVRNLGLNDSVIVEWYGVLDQNNSDCMDRTRNLLGNGAQINNVCTPKVNPDYMYVKLRSVNSNTYTVRMEMFNWRNGPGCN